MQRWPPLFDVLWLRWGSLFWRVSWPSGDDRYLGGWPWDKAGVQKCHESPEILCSSWPSRQLKKPWRTRGPLVTSKKEANVRRSGVTCPGLQPQPTYSWSGLLSISPCCLNACLWCVSWTVLGSLKSPNDAKTARKTLASLNRICSLNTGCWLIKPWVI